MAVGDYVTGEGLQIPTVEQLLADCAAEQRAEVDPNLNTDPDSVVGQLNGIFCSHLREAWEVLRVAFGGFDPDAAEGSLLVGLSAISGTTPAAATRSRFVGSKSVSLDLDAATTVPAGTTFHVAGDPATRFTTEEDVVSTVAGTYPVEAVSEVTGPVHANAHTLTVVATPVVGLNAVDNPFDAIVGQAQDTDAQLRQRREDELRATGAGTVDSLRSDVLDVALDDETKPVLTCTVFENDTNSTDLVTGLPPHSLEVMAYDGVVPSAPDDVLAQVVWEGKPGGILLVGTTSGSAVDGTGATRTVPFTRPTIVSVKFAVGLEVDLSKYAGDAAAKTAIGDAFRSKVSPGKIVRANDYVRALLGVAGVLDVTNMQIALVGDPYPPDGTNLALGLREMGDADSGDMAVTAVPGVP